MIADLRNRGMAESQARVVGGLGVGERGLVIDDGDGRGCQDTPLTRCGFGKIMELIRGISVESRESQHVHTGDAIQGRAWLV
jgi:hypothetical protein